MIVILIFIVRDTIVIIIFIVRDTIVIIIIILIIKFTISIKVFWILIIQFIRNSIIVIVTIFRRFIGKILGELHWVDDGSQQEGNQSKNESVDGDTVVLVLFVGVSASQTKTGQEGSEEVEDETNDDKGCSSTKVTCTSSSSTSSSFRHAKRQRCWSSSRDTLHEQAFPPAICQHPVRSGGGGHHQDHREAAGEGYHLEWPGDRDGLDSNLWGSHPAVCWTS